MVLEINFSITDIKKNMQNAEQAILTTHLLTDRQIQNEVIYSTRLELLATSQFTNSVRIPLPAGIQETVGLFSLRLLHKGQTLQNYQFQKLLTVGQHNIQLPMMTFKISLQIPVQQQSVCATSLHFYGPNLSNLLFPFSNQSVFPLITKAVRDIEGCAFTNGHSMTFFSSQERSQTIDLYATFLQNTPYVTRIPLYKGPLRDKVNQSLQITNINVNGYVLCFIDTFLMYQSKYNVKKAVQAAMSAGITPEALFDFQLKQDDFSKFKTSLTNFLKAAGAKGKQVDNIIQLCNNLSKSISFTKTYMTISRQAYIIEPKQINNIKLNQSVLSTHISQMFQEFVNRVRGVENYLLLFPYDTPSKIYSLKFVNSKEQQETQIMLTEKLNQNATLYDIITSQPVLIEANNIKNEKIQIANEELRRYFDLILAENTSGQIGTITNNQFSFFYYYPAHKIITNSNQQEEAKQVVQQPIKATKMATAEQIKKLKMLQHVVQNQQTEIEMNQKKLDKYYSSKTNYQKLTQEEINYLSKSIHMKEPQLVVTVNDATTDIMKTYSKRQLSKMLIQGLQQLNHDSLKIYDDANKLRTEEKKLLEDQQAIIHYMTKTLQQFERKKQGMSYISQLDGSVFDNVSNIDDRSHYIACKPKDFEFDQSLQFRQDSQLQFEPQQPIFGNPQNAGSMNNSVLKTQTSVINTQPQNLSQHSKLLGVQQQLEQQKENTLTTNQMTSKSQIFENKSATTTRVASSRHAQPKPIEQSTISQYRRPPQILANVSQASQFLEMNMK